MAKFGHLVTYGRHQGDFVEDFEPKSALYGLPITYCLLPKTLNPNLPYIDYQLPSTSKALESILPIRPILYEYGRKLDKQIMM